MAMTRAMTWALTRALALGIAMALGVPAAGAQPRASGDTLPAGYGSLRRDDVSITVQVQGLTARAIPLDENVIRALAPDAYASLHALRLSRAPAMERVRARMGLASVQAWHVEFFNSQPGEARFDPKGMQLRSAGRDFRPLDVVPLQRGFEDGRLAQSRRVDAIFLFDPAVSLTQPLTVTLAGEQSAAWSDGANSVLSRLERERAAVWSRAAAGRKMDSTTKGKAPPWQ